MRAYTTSSRVLMPDLADPTLVGAWNMKPRGGRIIDHCAVAHDGTPYHGTSTSPSIFGPAQLFTGATFIDCGDLGRDIQTLAFWIRPHDVGNDYVFDIKAGTHYVYITAGVVDPDGWAAPTVYVDGAASTDALILHKWTRVVITTATPIDADNFNFGVAAANFGHFEIAGVEVYSDEKTAAWAAADYRFGASAIPFKTAWGARDTLLAAEPAGMYVGDNSTPFEILSGTHRLQTLGVFGGPVKHIWTVSAGDMYMRGDHMMATPTERAFGTWDFWTYKGAGTTLDVNIIATGPALSGYTLRHDNLGMLSLQEVGVGAVCTRVGAAPSNQLLHHRITRAFNGDFVCYMDGAQWGTGNDLTTTEAAGILIGGDPGTVVMWSDQRGGHCFTKYQGVLPL